jgi:hypothetical protein
LNKISMVVTVLVLVGILSGCGGSSGSGGSNTPPVIPNPAPENQAPILNTMIGDIEAKEGLFVDIDLLDRFSDEGSISYSITDDQGGAISWLSLSESQMRVYGIPSATQIGEQRVTLTAADEQGLSTSTTFLIDVSELPSTLSAEQITQDNQYINEFLRKESGFIKPDIGLNRTTAMTHDGIRLNPNTLLPVDEPSKFSAASKESLHLNLLAKVLLDEQKAKLLIGGDATAVNDEVLATLTQKISSYEKFNVAFPAFGGFLPWFISEDRGSGVSVYPLADWEDRLPALDNGQLAWSIYLVYKALDKAGYDELAARYEQRFQLMTKYAKTIFYDPLRNVISGVSRFEDINGAGNSSLAPEQLTYIKDSYALTDPFEGELMVVFMSLFSEDLTETEVQSIWANKFLNTRQYTSASEDTLTVVEGWAFSSHEQWKYLVLPYLDLQVVRGLYLNGEKVRADYSNRNDFRGFFASVHNSSLEYVSLLGVPSVASETNVGNQVIAPYATFPMLLSDYFTGTNTGLNWLRNVLAYDSLVGELGVIESYDTDTFAIAPILTWDGKVLTSFAMMKGVVDEVREFLLEDQLYLPFITLIETEHEKITSVVEGLDLAISQPKDLPIPSNPCSANTFDLNILNDFECQQNVSLMGVDTISNPTISDTNISLQVGRYTDPAGPWDALILDFANAIELNERNQFSIKVLAPVTGILKVKLEGGLSAEVELDLPITELNQWIEYNFDFASQANQNHQKIVVFFNAGVANQGSDQYLIDDLKLSAISP